MQRGGTGAGEDDRQRESYGPVKKHRAGVMDSGNRGRERDEGEERGRDRGGREGGIDRQGGTWRRRGGVYA